MNIEIEKANKVLSSCITSPQLDVAIKYINLLLRKLDTNSEPYIIRNFEYKIKLQEDKIKNNTGK